MQRINHRLRRFVGMSKLKKVALNVIAQQLTEAEIGHLRGVFERLDAEGNGVISVNELEQVVQQEGLGSLQDDVVRLLQGIDIDGSNSLNYREFLAATMEASFTMGSGSRGYLDALRGAGAAAGNSGMPWC